MSLNLSSSIQETKEYTFIKITHINIDVCNKRLDIGYKRGYMDGEIEVFEKETNNLIKSDEGVNTDYSDYMVTVSDVYTDVKNSLYNLLESELNLAGTIV